MTCDDSRLGRQEKSNGVVIGLCLPCALELLKVLPTAVPTAEPPKTLSPAQWYNPSKFRKWGKDEETWREASPGYEETVRMALTFPRCDDCRQFTGSQLSDPPRVNYPAHDRLGRGCANDALAAGEAAYPLDFPEVFAIGEVGTKDGTLASEILHQATLLVRQARANVYRDWPPCESCPKPQLLQKKVPSGVRDSILNALARHVTLDRNGIIALGIKGVIQNTFSSSIKPLIDEGLVKVESRGPAKFYSLA